MPFVLCCQGPYLDIEESDSLAGVEVDDKSLSCCVRWSSGGNLPRASLDARHLSDIAQFL